MKFSVQAIVKALVGLLVFISAVGCSFYSHADNGVDKRMYSINVHASNAADALNALAFQTGAVMLFPYREAKTRQANSVVGDYTIQEAITLMLKDSGLSGSLTSDGAIKISDSGSQHLHKSDGGRVMNSKKNLLAATVAFFMGSGAAVVNAAEDQNQVEELNQRGIDEIIVTAQKREQRLIDVPISIATLGEQKLKDMGIDGIDKLTYAIPNLSVRSSNESEKRFVIRGVSNVRGSSALVGVYLDEVPASLSPQTQPNLQLLDVQRVEVLRGPQGTLYGQGSTGGTIRFLTNNPTFDGISGEIGSSFYTTQTGDASSEVSAIANIPVIDDTLAFRVAASYKDIGGWIDQPDVNKEDINDVQESYIRIKGLWQASEDLTVNAMIIRTRNDAGAQGYGNIKDANDTPFWRHVERDGLPLGGPEISHYTDIYNLTLNYDLGFATLTSSTSQVDFGTDPYVSSSSISQDPAVNAGRFVAGIFFEVEGFSQEFRLAGAANNNKFDWVIGAFYSDVDLAQGVESANRYSDGVFVSPVASFQTVRSSKSTAIFANVDYHLTEQITLNAGARYFEDDRTADGTFYATPKGATFDHVSPTFGLSYALSNDASVYIRVAEGFRSGGFNTINNAEDFEPEIVRTYEMGAKALLLDGRLQTEAALFYSQYLDMQDIDFSDNVPGRGVTINVGEAEIQGVEWSAQLSVSEQISVGFSGHYMDTEFIKVSERGASFDSTDVGDPINYVPKYSASFNAKFDFEGPMGAAGFTALDYSVQAGSVEITTANRRVESDTLTHLNARLGLNWESFTAELFGRNLTNENDVTNPTNFNNYTQDRPRTWGISLGYRF